MPENYYLIDFECPRCGHFDEQVEVTQEEWREAIDENNGYIDHTCSRCGCEFKKQE